MNGHSDWTGGQYSLYRILFGSYLLVHFVQLAPWAAELFSGQGVISDRFSSPLLQLFPNILALHDSPTFVGTIAWSAPLLALLFLFGKYDRFAAVALWYIQACFIGRNPLILNPAMPFVGWLLLAHVLIPPAPYGSWPARGRTDPDGGWRMPVQLWGCAWILMALGYSYSGVTKLISPSWIDGSALSHVLANPLARGGLPGEWIAALPEALLRGMTWGALALELAFAPLALIRRLRPWLWAAMLGMHLGLIMLIDFADLSLGMLMIHLFTFNPAWIPRRNPERTDWLFYDGSCGLCHRAVRFVLAEDRDGKAFRFSALASERVRQLREQHGIGELPDSIVLLEADGRLLVRSAAVLQIANKLGGYWRLGALLLSLIPRPLRDIAYDGIAAVRQRLFRRPADACPLIPERFRSRFE